jgi:hypothetical protein
MSRKINLQFFLNSFNEYSCDSFETNTSYLNRQVCAIIKNPCCQNFKNIKKIYCIHEICVQIIKYLMYIVNMIKIKLIFVLYIKGEMKANFKNCY